MRDRLVERFDTAENRISRRLANDSSIDTTKALVEKVAIEGSVSLGFAIPIALFAMGILWVLGYAFSPPSVFGSIVGIAVVFISCNYGSAAD